jgi:nucleoid-associated protein YgaU
VKKYVVKAGDSLSKIARDQLGDVSRWREIYELNKAVIGDNPNLIQPGQEYILPD